MPKTAADIHRALSQGSLAHAIGDRLTDTQPQGFFVHAPHIQSVCHHLYTNPDCYFDFLSCLSGLDNGPQADTMEVLYHIYSLVHEHALTLRVMLPRVRPSLPSVSSVWRSAEWHEREAYDLFGIVFDNHPDLRRILLPDDWTGHPLRKDYQADEYYHGLKIESDNT